MAVVETKSKWASKTLWTNVIALLAMAAQLITGKEVFDLAAQGVLLSIVNLILRPFTKTELV